MTNISLVTKNLLFGQSLKRLLEVEMKGVQVKCYNHTEDLLALKESPGLVLYELVAGFDNFQSFRTLTDLFAEVKILVMNHDTNPGIYKGLINNGVKGSISVCSEINELIKAIHEITADKIYYPYEVLKKIMQETKPEAEKQTAGLTDREIEILRLLCEGLSNEQISDKLHLSYDTVKWHRGNILIKCGCKNILALYKYALKQKLLPVSEMG